MDEVVSILDEVKSSITGELGIGGSLAQRYLAPELPSLREKSVEESDLDLLLLPNESACEVEPSIEKNFDIIEISPSEGGYYFGLVHKRTNKWVDLFPKASKSGLVSVEVEGRTYLAESLENQVNYLTRDILRRSSNKLPVREKWITKLRELYMLNSLNKSVLGVSEEEIGQALSIVPTSPTEDSVITGRLLAESRTVTPNGLRAKSYKSANSL